jgi:hypothetical protein
MPLTVADDARGFFVRFRLTWFALRMCWKKHARGKVHYLGKGKCKGKYDMDGYHAALDEWNKLNGRSSPRNAPTIMRVRPGSWFEGGQRDAEQSASPDPQVVR